MGNHVAVTIGGLQGHLELHVFKPLIGANVCAGSTCCPSAWTASANARWTGPNPIATASPGSSIAR
jgi:fumarate hydratase class II